MNTPAGAAFSEDRLHRYVLWRVWGDTSRRLVLIGLNPSTADELTDDPTIRRGINFARREGCGALVMVNLFTYRATDPRDLIGAREPLAPQADGFLRLYCCDPRAVVVAAWGVHGKHRKRGLMVERMLTAEGVRLLCFGRSAGGYPRHPLYLPNAAPLVPYV